MKVCIAGAGAIGGLFAGRLGRVGAPVQVSVLARGATLAAITSEGLKVTDSSGLTETLRLPASSNAENLGHQDIVVIAVKTTGLLQLATMIGPLIGPHTVIVSAMNGLPWWFGQARLPRPAWAASPLQTIDPGAALQAALPVGQVIGCVTHLSASSPRPGVVVRGNGNRVLFGDPSLARDAQPSSRLQQVVKLFADGGFESLQVNDIEMDVWVKLWGNMTMNPASAITGATGDLLLESDLVRNFLSDIMREAAMVGDKIGLPIAMLPEERHAMTRKLGAFKTSMLQDVEAGRPMELDALLAGVVELGERVGVAMPYARTLLGLAQVKAKVIAAGRNV